MATQNPKSKIKQLIKKREAIIKKIEKDEIAYEKECIKRKIYIQNKQDELREINQEIFSLIDNDEVNAFMRRFASDFLQDKSTPEDSKDKNRDGNEGICRDVTDEAGDIEDDVLVTEDADSGQDADKSSTFNGDEYIESFRKQYGL